MRLPRDCLTPVHWQCLLPGFPVIQNRPLLNPAAPPRTEWLKSAVQTVRCAACRYLGSAYCLHRPQLLERSIELAVAEGCRVSLDLASFEVVRDFRRELLAILEGKHISLCICNEVRSVGAAEVCLPGCLGVCPA